MRLQLEEYLKHEILLLDGGQGTELEKRGINIAHPLWSTLPYVTKDKKHLKIIKEMYSAFESAGCNALMTITYQASFLSMKNHSDGLINNEKEYTRFLDYVIDYTENQCISPNSYLVGSVGPYAAYLSNGAEYSGHYIEDNIDFIEFFRPQVQHFAVSSRIDLIGIETIPNFEEFKALLRPEFSRLCALKPYYISITTDNEGNLRDGTARQDICETIKRSAQDLPPNLVFFGINCVSFAHCADILKLLNDSLDDIGVENRLRFRAVYPNSGEVYHGDTHSWGPNPEIGPADTWENLASKVVQQGCLMIGGCCRTSPADLRQIASVVSDIKKGL